MPLDPYQPCPCGSGNKIKFCCCKDIVSELDKVVRAVQGEQRVAALEQIDRLIVDKGPRAALMVLKADVQMAQDDAEGARETITEFQVSDPQNPVGLAQGAMLSVIDGDTESAVEQLQRALECTDKLLSTTVYHAIGSVSDALLRAGNVLASRGHLLLQAGLAGDQDEEPAQRLIKLNLSRQIPLLLKDDKGFTDCPDDVPWKGEFQAALKAAYSGSWLAACESLDSLALKATDEPIIIKNIAVLRSWLGQTDLAVAAWRSYSQLEQLPMDDRIEAEALAQLIDSPAPSDEYDEVTVTYSIADANALMERLLSDKRIVSIPVDPKEFADGDDPPPKGVFWLLDRPTIESEPADRQSIPLVAGELHLFGKQTQREARLDLSAVKDESFPGTKAILSDVMGELGGPPSGETKLGTASAITSIFNWRWHLPVSIAEDRKRELVAEQQEEAVTERWPKLKLAVLDRKTPIDAAKDERYRIKLLAAILLLDLATESSETPFDFNRLRDQLELPRREPITIEGDEVLRLPLPRLGLIQIEGLSDTNLATAFRRSVFAGYSRATLKYGEEILRRDLPTELITPDEVYDPMIQWCPDKSRAAELAQQAQQHAGASGESPARWMLMELAIRLSRGEGVECQRLVQTLQGNHLSEPGISDGLFRLLVAYGIVTPDGQPTAMSRAATAPPEAPAGIWTPGSDTAAPTEEKSKLWVPGMD